VFQVGPGGPPDELGILGQENHGRAMKLNPGERTAIGSVATQSDALFSFCDQPWRRILQSSPTSTSETQTSAPQCSRSHGGQNVVPDLGRMKIEAVCMRRARRVGFRTLLAVRNFRGVPGTL
jgi:hypothetical protein